MTHRHIETITFGTCLVICAHTHTQTHTHTYMHAHILTWARALWGCPPFKRWLGGRASLLLSHSFHGGLENYLGGGGGGVELRGLGGCSFLCFPGGFLLDFYDI